MRSEGITDNPDHDLETMEGDNGTEFKQCIHYLSLPDIRSQNITGMNSDQSGLVSKWGYNVRDIPHGANHQQQRHLGSSHPLWKRHVPLGCSAQAQIVMMLTVIFKGSSSQISSSWFKIIQSSTCFLAIHNPFSLHNLTIPSYYKF